MFIKKIKKFSTPICWKWGAALLEEWCTHNCWNGASQFVPARFDSPLPPPLPFPKQTKKGWKIANQLAKGGVLPLIWCIPIYFLQFFSSILRGRNQELSERLRVFNTLMRLVIWEVVCIEVLVKFYPFVFSCERGLKVKLCNLG